MNVEYRQPEEEWKPNGMVWGDGDLGLEFVAEAEADPKTKK